jgi:hypothetical protein
MWYDREMLVAANGAVASRATRSWWVLSLAVMFAVVGLLSVGATVVVLGADQPELPAVELTR